MPTLISSASQQKKNKKPRKSHFTRIDIKKNETFKSEIKTGKGFAKCASGINHVSKKHIFVYVAWLRKCSNSMKNNDEDDDDDDDMNKRKNEITSKHNQFCGRIKLLLQTESKAKSI